MKFQPRVLVGVVLAIALCASPSFADDLASWQVTGDNIVFTPISGTLGFLLTTSSPAGEVFAQEFAPGELPTFRAVDGAGASLGNGTYTFELVALPEARERTDSPIAEYPTQTVFATVTASAFLSPIEEEVQTKDQVFLDDLIVDGSACIGFDCANGEDFGFDTLRLKENNLRIKFDDTSTNNFPSTDWQLTANDSGNGGANKFSIDDITGGRTPFTIRGGAPTNALFVASSGNVGLSTATPVTDLHIVSGNTPTLRLEQNGSSGFGPQTWDIAGNETNFFIRDATNGSKLPFRIRPDAPTNALYIDAEGDVSMGSASVPGDASLQVLANTGAADDVVLMVNNGPTRFALNNTVSGDTWRFNHANNGRLRISDQDGVVEFELDQAGNLVLSGTVTAPSDRNLKEGFEAVDPAAVLDAVAKMPLTTWAFKHDQGTKRHMGPMAQDFFAAFGLGMDDRHITLTDVGGVALAAIQGLQAQNTELTEANAALAARLAALEAMVETISNP